MKIIFLIASFNAFFFAVLLLQKRPKALHDIILILWLLYLGLYIGVYSFYSHDLFTHFKLLSISFISLLMLHGPFLYYYIQTLVSDKKQILLLPTRKISIIHSSELLLNAVSIRNRLLTGCLKILPGLLLRNSKRLPYKGSPLYF